MRELKNGGWFWKDSFYNLLVECKSCRVCKYKKIMLKNYGSCVIDGEHCSEGNNKRKFALSEIKYKEPEQIKLNEVRL